MLERIAVTDEDRVRFRFHTEDTIRAVKVIEALDSDRLRFVLRDDEGHEILRRAIGENTNPFWVTARVAETLSERGEIDERELDRLLD